MKPLALIFSVCAFFLIAQHAYAYDLRVAPDISVEENHSTSENLYLVGLKTFFNSTHDKDVLSVSADQTIQGSVFGDIFLMGNRVDLQAETFDDVRIIANDVRITGVTSKDLIIVANRVTIEEGAIINGDTLILANKVELGGKILGETQITSNSIAVHGSVVGPATWTTQDLSFSSGARVVSDIAYFSPQRATVEQGAQIQNQLNFNQIESITQNDFIKRIFFAFVSFWSIIKLVANLFVIFMLAYVFKVFSQSVVDKAFLERAYVLPYGVLSLVLVPVVIFLLFCSLVLIPISAILFLAFCIVFIILPAMSSILLASLYRVAVQKKKQAVDFNLSVLALIVLTFVGFVPYVGNIITYVVYAGTFGAIVLHAYDQVRRRRLKL